MYEIEAVEFYRGNVLDNDVIVKIPKAGVEGAMKNSMQNLNGEYAGNTHHSL